MLIIRYVKHTHNLLTTYRADANTLDRNTVGRIGQILSSWKKKR